MAKSQNITSNQYHEDFTFFWETLRDNYAYFDTKQTDWNKVKEIYEPQVSSIKSRSEFVRLLEKMIYELYDNHTHLLTNLQDSYKLAPSGLDIWAELKDGKYVINEVRKNSSADSAGIKAGMEVVSIDGIAVEQAVDSMTGKSLRKIDDEVMNWAIRVLIAGTHGTPRHLGIRFKGRDIVYDLPETENYENPKLLEARVLENNIGYIRINNTLWNNDLIAAFDNALDSVFNTNGLILDLRDTPGGGNTVVARAIMSRFISKEFPYQKHELPAEEREFGVKRSWVEYVTPRKTIYKNPLVVLADHWTGSMGEGITAGLDGMNRAVIAGTKLAGLAGAKYDFLLPNTNIGVSYAAEKLFQVNGTPRELFVPTVTVDLNDQNSNDLILETGIKVLMGKINK